MSAIHAHGNSGKSLPCQVNTYLAQPTSAPYVRPSVRYEPITKYVPTMLLCRTTTTMDPPERHLFCDLLVPVILLLNVIILVVVIILFLNADN